MVARAEPLSRPAWWLLGAVTAVVGAVLVVLAGRYGYHRDELYFLACGDHLAWGYPDQPPLTPFVARMMHLMAPGSLMVFRLPAVAVACGTTLLTGLMAREFGGGRFAQALAAVAVGTGAFVLASGHGLFTSSIDLLVWVTITWLMLRMVRTDDPRLWVAIGAVAGMGLLNKQLPVFLLFGLVVATVLTPAVRGLLLSRWVWIGALIAAAAWAPVLTWQAAHGWPQLTLAGQIRDEYGVLEERINFFVLQILIFSLGATVLWVIGFVRLLRAPQWRRYRLFAWAGLVIMVLFILTAGQGYYPAGIYPVLIAAGAVVVEQHSRGRWLALTAVVVTAALTVPAMLPILAPATLDRSVWAELAESQREAVGWPALVDLVADAHQSIPAAQRGRAGVFTVNYGEAGAVDLYGPARGLPHAWSGHNGFGLWGPPPEEVSPVIVVWEDGLPDVVFAGCRFYAKVEGPVHNEERDRASVYVCQGPVGGWRAAWPRLTHLSS